MSIFRSCLTNSYYIKDLKKYTVLKRLTKVFIGYK